MVVIAEGERETPSYPIILRKENHHMNNSYFDPAYGEACTNCKFYNFTDATDYNGECRLNPPRGFMDWPKVKDEDWCGQFKPVGATKNQPIVENGLHPDTPIDRIGLFSQRVKGLLWGAKITTVGELMQLSEKDILNIPQFGRKWLNEIKTVLERHGQRLAI